LLSLVGIHQKTFKHTYFFDSHGPRNPILKYGCHITNADRYVSRSFLLEASNAH